jgi:SAM-dependent methyltransferase
VVKPAFHSPITLAHDYWKRLVLPGDIVLDATCGNGYDTLFLVDLLETGKVYSFDIQPEAIQSTQDKLSPEQQKKVVMILGSHVTFPVELTPASVKLIVYNLGYLPGGDKSKTTLTESTLESLTTGLDLIRPDGAISITCYPGHPEGKKEYQAILAFVSRLAPRDWCVCQHSWVNRTDGPVLLWLSKIKGSQLRGQ